MFGPPPQKHPEFKTLSRASHEWLSTPVAAPSELEDLLNLLQRRGYTVVAVEQTTGSVPVTSFAFPRKCVLLLGAERTGVPARLLQRSVNAAVEIPQVGSTRSLNVHVSASIALYAYTQARMALDQ